MTSKKNHAPREQPLKWWQLSLLGVACTIGTGYFLGSGIAIKMTGPSILFSFLLAAIATYFVFDALARMTAAEPIQGSFRSFAKKAYGQWAGFSSGWVYWVSEMLISGSQMTALSLFTRYWLPDVPMWIFAAGYSILGVGVILLGTKGFESIEHILAVMKLAAIVMFLVLAAAALLGWIHGDTEPQRFGEAFDTMFAAGFIGWWSALIYAFYAFGGIEILGIMALRLRDPRDAPKAGKVMLILLTTLYISSLLLAIWLVSWRVFDATESPFIVALRHFDLPFVPHLFNGVLIIAGFSTMVASLFAVTNMMVTLAKDNDAPRLLAKSVKKRPLLAISFTTLGMILSIVIAFLLPERVYEYFTTAAGLMLLYNWLFILFSSGRILDLSALGQTKRWLGIVIIIAAVIGTVTHRTSRPGLWISLLFLLIIGGVTLIMKRVWRKQQQSQPNKMRKA
ncbi:transporter [Cohnella kolymensis]|uniref:Transporter n=2 Tax=Cohnella kolymensis TaxID=1590652 RepID=A0ABR5A0C8_9BACL|nr:transporter [Cohnella kolymensis]